MRDNLNALVAHYSGRIEGAKEGPLASLTFAAKDNFHIAGHATGCGNPDWLRTHPPETQTAPAVEGLIRAGAALTAKCHMDEIAFSLNGENAHYGTPVNVNAPGRIPGGSSSGSAAAVAGGLADFALGSDTLGSVRVPASYCGIYGIRPTHGRIPAEGLVPLAPSFDTIGWFARDPKILLKVGRVLFGEKKAQAPSRLLIPEDAWDLANPEVKEALSPFVKKIGAALGAAENIRLTEDGLEEWLPPARHLLGWEVWQAHGPWVEKERPAFGPHIEARFEWAAAMPAGKAEAARTIREAATRRMRALLTPGTLMAIPTAPGIAPVKNMEGPELEAFRHRLIQLTSIASVSGVPQISLPLGKVEGCPVGLSLIAGAGEDEALLEMAVRLRDS
ncbi:MAG: amidase [bacterium]|nr:amidase [bacterium]